MADRAELVLGLLEEVRVDGAGAQAARVEVLAQRAVVGDGIPREVHRDGEGGAGQAVHLGGVVDLLEDVARQAGGGKGAEPGAGGTVAPRRRLDLERPQARLDGVSGHVVSWIARPATPRKRS